MESLKGVYRKTLFYNEESGYGSFLMRPASGNPGKSTRFGLIKATGFFFLKEEEIPLECSGEWKQTQYGAEFDFISYRLAPCGSQNNTAFIMKLCPSMSYAKARQIADFFGDYLFTAPYDESAIEQAVRRTGSDGSIVTELFSKIKRLNESSVIFEMIRKNGGNAGDCAKILSVFPENACQMLINSPYVVAQKAGVNFKVMDRLALSQGRGTLDEERLRAIITWSVRRHTNAGNTFITPDEIYEIVKASFGGIPKPVLLSLLTDHPDVVRDENERYYLRKSLDSEKTASKEVSRLLFSRFAIPFRPELIDRVEAEIGRPLGKQQRQSFELLRTTGVKLFTGGPGTGKTTTVNCMLRYLELVYSSEFGRKVKISLCAPSGRAAQRMKEATGRPAMTVHKLIGLFPTEGGVYCKNASDPIDADVIVVDEVSMLGLDTFCRLLGAVKNGTLLLLVGDVNQLQSVEPGSVLADLVACGYVDRCHLTEIFRQKGGSLITGNALRIMAGVPDFEEGQDFEIIRTQPEDTPEIVRETAMRLMAESGNPDKVQILSPVKRGVSGVTALNKCLQDIFNPNSDKGNWIRYGSKNFRIGDRIITQSNNYSLGYFNGDIGKVVSISSDKTFMTVRIGEEEISIGKNDFADVDLGYALTVHKSQGSEYDSLIIVLPEDAGSLLDRNLLYTAVTRGKRKVIIVAEKDSIERAVRAKRRKERDSALSERIRKDVSETLSQGEQKAKGNTSKTANSSTTRG